MESKYSNTMDSLPIFNLDTKLQKKVSKMNKNITIPM